MTALPLDGVRVLDLTRLLPGNVATLLLAGLGADVVKVEDPRAGDGTRLAPPYAPTGESGAHVVLNRGKRSLALDLKDAEGRELFLSLVASSDVLVDGFRPGVLDRLGLGAEALAGANPRLVHVSITAWGDGDRAAVPGHDLNAAAVAGVLSLSVADDGTPVLPPVQVADLTAGLHAVVAVLSGLRVADAGAPFRADVAMSDAAYSLLTLAAGAYAASGEPPAAPGMLTGALACYGVYRCADGRHVSSGGLEPKFFARMVALMGVEQLAALQYDPTRQDELRRALAERFAARPRAEWLTLLADDDTCVTPVNDVAEAFADADAVGRGLVVTARLADGTPVPAVRAVPWLPAGSPADGAGAPALGADSDAVLAEAGVDPGRVAALRSRGVVA